MRTFEAMVSGRATSKAIMRTRQRKETRRFAMKHFLERCLKSRVSWDLTIAKKKLGTRLRKMLYAWAFYVVVYVTFYRQSSRISKRLLAYLVIYAVTNMLLFGLRAYSLVVPTTENVESVVRLTYVVTTIDMVVLVGFLDRTKFRKSGQSATSGSKSQNEKTVN